LKLVRLDLSDASIASQLLELQREAYRVEAALLGSNEIPPLRETLPELQAGGETFLGALVDGVLAGAISWKLDGDTIDLHRLVVHPAHFRKGIGVALVRAALAAEPTARRAIVQTGAANAPAVALYRQEGFEPAGEIEPVPGLRVACFTKLLR
jgi:ribosomal protein S18 acetylase RimI-like enzyme